jgi:hypothetical protein
LKTKGVVGKLATVMAKCCRIEQEEGNGESRPRSLARVVPVQREEQERQQRSTLKKEIVALKWQKKIRQTLMKNNTPLKMARTPSRMQQSRTWRTQRVEEIQNNHENHRNLALKNIERQHSQRRTSLQMRVDARKKKKEEGEEVIVALRGNEMDGDKVLVKEDGGKPMGVDGRSVEQTGSMVGDARENEKLLKSVRLQQRILRIKEVQMSRVRGKRLAKGV